MHRLSERWTRHEDNKDRIRETILASTTVLSRLQEMILEDIEELSSRSMKESDFTPGWETKQAFRLGSLSILHKYLDYVTPKETK